MLKTFSTCAIVLVATTAMLAQITGDVLGMHDLSPGGKSPIKGTLSGPCLYCHAPHSGIGSTALQVPLWSQALSHQTYTNLYTSLTNKAVQPPPGSDSSLCLSCHDGTVAPGTLQPYGQVPMSPSGALNSADVVGPDLQSVHPFSLQLPINPAPGLSVSLNAVPPHTDDTTGAVRLIKGNVECTSCHNPHVQNIDPNSNFLAINNTNSLLCLACHSPSAPSGTGMGLAAAVKSRAAQAGRTTSTVTTRTNPLEQWTSSAHAIATNKVAGQVSMEDSITPQRMSSRPSLGSYNTVAQNGCLSCHKTHNAQSQVSLLRGSDDQACIACHNGGSNISPVAPNVFAELVSPKIGHSFVSDNNSHQANESTLLNQNRHATCVDCHNPHASSRVTSFASTTALRPSQNLVTGISAVDGVTVLAPAVNQYENCLRCHGTSTGKKTSAKLGYLQLWTVSAGDPLNIIPQFSATATSSHPVMHDRTSPFPQPSLRASMLNLDGKTPGRRMGTRILCTDCHNSDDNREFGGSGPNGPHGSTFWHLLERQYVFSQAPLPGRPVTNLSPTPNLSASGGISGGPYALCAKCHDLVQILSNSTFSEHARHINDGFSCSVCHTAHGMGATSSSVSGERLVNFDVNVVAANGTTPIAYSRATNSCSLVCHNHTHSLVGAAVKGSRRP